jgi:hypothetical protein
MPFRPTECDRAVCISCLPLEPRGSTAGEGHTLQPAHFSYFSILLQFC